MIQEYYINSFLDRTTDENEVGARFSVILPQGREIKLNPNQRDKQIQFKIQNLQIPNVLYNFPDKASNFFWEENYNVSTGVGDVRSLKIDTNRVYATPAELITQLNNALDDNNNATNLLFSYDNNTKKVSVKNETGNTIRIISSFRFANSESVLTFKDINDRLGFSQDLTGSKGVLLNDETLTGAGLLQMNRTNAYHLVLDEAGSSYAQTIVPIKDGQQRVVCNVPVGSFGTLSTLAYVSSEWFNLPTRSSISVLRFRVLDDEFDDVSDEFPNNYPITLSFQLKIE